jgi:kanamycin nucleotidyltransferase
MAASIRLALAKSITMDLRGREGRNLVAVGVYGSVARGEERRHSDIDLLVVVRRKSPRIHHVVRDRIVATILQQTVEDAKSEVTGSRQDLNAILGGWTSLKPLYDPTGILRRLRARARRPSARQFREAAYWACLEVYEDIGKLWNAIEARDKDEAREMAIWFTGAAAGALLDLHGHVLKTGRRAIVEASRFGKVGHALRRLRYDTLSFTEMGRLSELVWAGLLDGAAERGIRLPPVRRNARGSSSGHGSSSGKPLWVSE